MFSRYLAEINPGKWTSAHKNLKKKHRENAHTSALSEFVEKKEVAVALRAHLASERK